MSSPNDYFTVNEWRRNDAAAFILRSEPVLRVKDGTDVFRVLGTFTYQIYLIYTPNDSY